MKVALQSLLPFLISQLAPNLIKEEGCWVLALLIFNITLHLGSGRDSANTLLNKILFTCLLKFSWCIFKVVSVPWRFHTCVWLFLLPTLSYLSHISITPPPLYSSIFHVHVFLFFLCDSLSLTLCVNLGMGLSDGAWRAHWWILSGRHDFPSLKTHLF